MKTIKRKLFIVFTLLMVAVILGGLLLNIIFLKPYYIYKNKNIFMKTSESIIDEYTNSTHGIATFLNEINTVDSISSFITDNKFNIEYNSSLKKSGNNNSKIPKGIETYIINNRERLENKNLYSILEKDNKPLILFVTKLGNDKLLILTKPLKSITESVYMATQFYVFAGVLIFAIGSVAILILSNRITKPIIEMSNVAMNISNLNFDKRVNITSQDELGALGKSINDISERLSASMDLLKQDIERRKDLVRNLSHELKTPIGVVKGYAEGLKYGVADNKEKIDKYCKVIVDECDQMDSMVRELLNLSKLESGVFQLTPKKIDLCDLINDILEVFEHEFSKKGILVKFKCTEKIIVVADYELMERVMKNFITNAINHSEGEKYIIIDAVETKIGTKVTIFNTGKHIPEKDMKNIWEVFSKVDKARSREYGGHGLGLSIVKLIIELHNGTVGVENINGGVIFNFEI